MQVAFGMDVDGSNLNFIAFVVVPLITAVVSPLGYAFTMSILNDLKLRKEGADLDARMGEIENA